MTKTGAHLPQGRAHKLKTTDLRNSRKEMEPALLQRLSTPSSLRSVSRSLRRSEQGVMTNPLPCSKLRDSFQGVPPLMHNPLPLISRIAVSSTTSTDSGQVNHTQGQQQGLLTSLKRRADCLTDQGASKRPRSVPETPVKPPLGRLSDPI